MNLKKLVIPLIIVSVVLSCVGLYLVIPQPVKWAITSLVEVPACAAAVADQLGIQHDFIAVKDYILQLLVPGMTPEEVERTLSHVGSVSVTDTFVDDEQKIHVEVFIELCDNPFGNVVLFLYYSEDGHLIRATDPYDN